MAKNVFVAQSGGPSAVINNSIRGVIDAVRGDRSGTFGRIYAGAFGILGALEEKLLDISAQRPEEIELLEVTPAAGAMGSCRYKLPKVSPDDLLEKTAKFDIATADPSNLPEDVQDYARIVQVFNAHDIGYFFYAGGNDSMETAYKLSLVAETMGLDLVCTGVPKTIDNDVGDAARELVDHTPGYGSTARYWRDLIQSAEEENRGSATSDPVLIMQVMGRKVGYLPAAARLADPDRGMPLVLILTEMLENERKGKGEDVEEANKAIAQRNFRFIEEQIARRLKEHGRALVVVSEGAYVGELGTTSDSFGHAAYSTGVPVAARIAMKLNAPDGLLKRLGVPGSARFNVPGTDQRGFIGSVSARDLREAYESGRYAVSLALKESGFMATIKRGEGKDGAYEPVYDKVPLQVVASVDRAFPGEWVVKELADVSDDFVRYAAPLIRTDLIVEREFDGVEGYLLERDRVRAETFLSVVLPLMNGRRRFTKFEPIYAEKKLDSYLPVKLRGKKNG